MKKPFFFLFALVAILLGSMNIQAQVPSDLEDLHRLKNGVLLVKLYTRNKGVEALKNHGLVKKAAALEKEQAFKNLAISHAFANNFAFTPKVYFFYSDDSKKVLQGEFDGVLMGYDLKPLPNINLGNTAYYIAEFGYTEGKGINALLIRNNQFEQLDPPFPYFVRTYEGIPFLERAYSKVVELWNDKLFKRYSKFFEVEEADAGN